jgi:hypothetical protein
VLSLLGFVVTLGITCALAAMSLSPRFEAFGPWLMVVAALAFLACIYLGMGLLLTALRSWRKMGPPSVAWADRADLWIGRHFTAIRVGVVCLMLLFYATVAPRVLSWYSLTPATPAGAPTWWWPDFRLPKAEPGRSNVRWATRLYNGEQMTIVLGDMVGVQLGRLIPGESYTVRFKKESCEWETIGPVNDATHGLIEGYVNRAGSYVRPYSDTHDSGSVTSECHDPLKRKVVILGRGAQFDINGRLHFGVWDRFGQRFPPFGEFVLPLARDPTQGKADK